MFEQFFFTFSWQLHKWYSMLPKTHYYFKNQEIKGILSDSYIQWWIYDSWVGQALTWYFNTSDYLNARFNLSHYAIIFGEGLLLIVFWVFLTVLLSWLFFFSKAFSDTIEFIITKFDYVEEELGQFRHVINIMFIFICGFYYDFMTNHQREFSPIIYHWTLYILALGMFLFVVYPIFMIFDHGYYFITYVRGETSKKSIFFEVFMDYLNFVSFFLRVNIQQIRLFIISLICYMYTEVFLEYTYMLYTIEVSIYDVNNVFDFTYFSVVKLLQFWFHLVYEIAHFWVVVLNQSSVFAMVVFALIQFLYTCYLLDQMEKFFMKKGSQNL